ncbi:helix-turn-helix transcriptional regulator [Parafrankia sp. EUN1f]|uniref:helix-turn-helix transcriptional regulator n=1 Tax=Parafrankia sp. EUN1f TaxID=102897 RepID=UPI00350F8935
MDQVAQVAPVLPIRPRAERRRSDLALFLRSRRERITPDDVGMPPGPRRRTPGLRREEVAQLAGVGVTWYTWLEQGRPINASPQVLDAVARTLRLGPAEREHLYRLADTPQPHPAADEETTGIPADIRTILDGLDPLPAALVNARSDVLSFNATFAALVPCLANAPVSERNSIWFTFTAPPVCNPIVNSEELAAEHAGIFRYRYSQHLGEPEWQEFVHRLCAASPEFARLWASHDVVPPRPCNKIFRYPGIADIATRSTNLELSYQPGTRVIVYTPINDESRAGIAWLREHPDAATTRHEH